MGRSAELTTSTTGRHETVEVYRRCGCDPGSGGDRAAHFVVPGVGVTCARGLLYVVGAQCCCGENRRRCEEAHVRRQGLCGLAQLNSSRVRGVPL